MSLLVVRRRAFDKRRGAIALILLMAAIAFPKFRGGQGEAGAGEHGDGRGLGHGGADGHVVEVQDPVAGGGGRADPDGGEPHARGEADEAEAGERSAIVYTIFESCRRRGIDPYAYLRDVLTRLPWMTNWQIKELVPEAWAKAQRSAVAKAA